MFWSHSPRAVREHPAVGSATETRLRGIWLALARLAWAGMAGLALLLFILGVPARYDHLRNLSGGDALGLGWTPMAVRAALAQVGLSTDFRAAYLVALAVLVAMGALAVAVVILWRKSDDWLALFVSLFLLTFCVWPTGVTDALLISHPIWQTPVQMLTAFSVIAFLLFGLLFPDGRFTPRWTWIVALVWSPLVLYESISDQPYGRDAWLVPLLWISGWGIAIFAQVYRYARVSGPVQRQQTKWVVFGVAAPVMAILVFVGLLPVLVPALYQASVLGLSFEMVFTPILFGAVLFLPLSVGVALLRYRLWDLDLLVNRALVYGVLTASVLSLYVLVVGWFATAAQAQGNFLLSLLVAGLVALLLHPLREWLQRGVNHLMYGQRDEPYAVISRLGQRLEATLAPQAALRAIVETVAQALKLPYTAVCLETGSEASIVAAAGAPVGTPMSLPLSYQGEVIGQLLLTPRRPGEALTPPDQRLLEDLTRQIGMASHMARLTDDLQRARERLVIAREEERRRLRRDLHDGLGPTLAALALKASTISDLIPTAATVATQLSNELSADIRATVGEIRRLVYALRPPALDDLGLVAALRECAAQASRSLQEVAGSDYGDGPRVTVDAPDRLPSLPAAVEVAAYRIVQEALTNVVRHAQAHTCAVRLSLAETLQIEVSDDGMGLPTERQAGVGLLSMRERAAELGGSCVIERGAAGGTRVCARLPVRSPHQEEVDGADGADGAFARADRG
jgi:signal transduction histidine kinase